MERGSHGQPGAIGTQPPLTSPSRNTLCLATMSVCKKTRTIAINVSCPSSCFKHHQFFGNTAEKSQQCDTGPTELPHGKHILTDRVVRCEDFKKLHACRRKQLQQNHGALRDGASPPGPIRCRPRRALTKASLDAQLGPPASFTEAGAPRDRLKRCFHLHGADSRKPYVFSRVWIRKPGL